MSQTITVKLSDQAYDALRRRAQAAGTSESEEAAASLEQQLNGPSRGEDASAEARQRFERHFGEIDLGYPTGTNNADIDADLDRERLSHHGKT